MSSTGGAKPVRSLAACATAEVSENKWEYEYDSSLDSRHTYNGVRGMANEREREQQWRLVRLPRTSRAPLRRSPQRPPLPRSPRMSKRTRSSSSASSTSGDESDGAPPASMSMAIFEAKTQRFYQEMDRAGAGGRFHMGKAAEEIVKHCNTAGETEVTVKLLETLAGKITGMPRYASKKPKHGSPADGGVFAWFKELVTAGELSYNPKAV